MTLFWHNHFATANSKVNNSVLMLQQIQLFRDNGLGNFETLLQKVTRDPAMLIWLDNRQNRKGAPNENYAREVQELFTVGIGNYTEQDINEAARAFTGHTLDRNLKLHVQQEPARRRRQDVPGPDGQLRRRRHPRHPGPQSGHGALHHHQAVHVFRLRQPGPVDHRSSGEHVRQQRASTCAPCCATSSAVPSSCRRRRFTARSSSPST